MAQWLGKGERVVMGDIASGHVARVAWEVLCRRHHLRAMTSPAARVTATSSRVPPFELDLCPNPPTRKF
jgi:thymidine kinase